MKLSSIQSPSAVKALSEQELKELAGEIREEIIRTVSENGGHLASNLGAVELTIALHRVFDCPADKLIFDVGHQCYPHKLLTGRGQAFSTLRHLDATRSTPATPPPPFPPRWAWRGPGTCAEKNTAWSPWWATAR